MWIRIAQWAFLVLVVSLPVVRPFNFSLRGITIPYTDVIFVPVVAAYLIAAARGEIKSRFDRTFIFVAIYAAALTIAALMPNGSVTKLAGEYYLFGLCFISFQLCSEERFFRKTVIASFVGTTITVVASVAGVVLFYAGFADQDSNYFLSNIGSLPSGNYPRIQGLFANPNTLCTYLNISLVLLIADARSRMFNRWLGIAAIILVGVTSLFTISPGLGGIFLSVGLWVWAGGFSKSRLAALVSGIVLSGVIMALTLVSLDTANTTADVKLPLTEKVIEPSVRVLVWQNVLEHTAQSPIFGNGTGSATASLVYTQLSGERQLLADAHNMYLNVLGQAGMVGLAAFIACLISVFRRCTWRAESNSWHLALSCAFVGAFLYQGLSGSFEDARHIWVMIGMLIAASNFKSDISRASTTPSLRPST